MEGRKGGNVRGGKVFKLQRYFKVNDIRTQALMRI